MRCKSSFSNFVHTLCADLHLHPFALRSFNGDVERLVAIGFRNGNPVFEARHIGSVDIGNDGIGNPAILLFLFLRRVENDANGKEVVHFIEIHVFFLHLIPDAIDRLGSPLDFEFNVGILQSLTNRFYEMRHIAVADLLGFVELFCDLRVDFSVEIFQRKVFELGFNGVESETVSQRRIEIACFR